MRRNTDVESQTELTESLEDYLEVILHVVEERRIVRPKDIVERMRVRGASVTGALRALSKRGLIRYAPYDAISLTDAGTAVAKDIIHRHEALRGFLHRVLGINAADADTEACRMEHAVSREVMGRLITLATFLEDCPRARVSTVVETVRAGASSLECKGCKRATITFSDAGGGQ